MFQFFDNNYHTHNVPIFAFNLFLLQLKISTSKSLFSSFTTLFRSRILFLLFYHFPSIFVMYNLFKNLSPHATNTTAADFTSPLVFFL